MRQTGNVASPAGLRRLGPVTIVRGVSERSAARLAHLSGGQGVPSSNLGAPTNKIKALNVKKTEYPGPEGPGFQTDIRLCRQPASLTGSAPAAADRIQRRRWRRENIPRRLMISSPPDRLRHDRSARRRSQPPCTHMNEPMRLVQSGPSCGYGPGARRMLSPANSSSLKKSQVPAWTCTEAIWFFQPRSPRRG